ncbi:MAG: aspartate 1-decarboxylase, partial [Rikenellaceae bacterium]|nr:aspartate 1-decarboxylase [Rikenellaceae bacterium]
AARKVAVGDLIIIISYALMDFEEAKNFKPSIIFPDSRTNRLIK